MSNCRTLFVAVYENDSYTSHTVRGSSGRGNPFVARVAFLSKRVLYVYMAKHSWRVSQSDVPSFNVETTLHLHRVTYQSYGLQHPRLLLVSAYTLIRFVQDRPCRSCYVTICFYFFRWPTFIIRIFIILNIIKDKTDLLKYLI